MTTLIILRPMARSGLMMSWVVRCPGLLFSSPEGPEVSLHLGCNDRRVERADICQLDIMQSSELLCTIVDDFYFFEPTSPVAPLSSLDTLVMVQMLSKWTQLHPLSGQ